MCNISLLQPDNLMFYFDDKRVLKDRFKCRSERINELYNVNDMMTADEITNRKVASNNHPG